MEITQSRRWAVRSGRHLHDPDRAAHDEYGDGDGWVATFESSRDAEFVAALVADTAAEREQAARAAAHTALWNARRAMSLAGIRMDTVAGRIMDDAIAQHEPRT